MNALRVRPPTEAEIAAARARAAQPPARVPRGRPPSVQRPKAFTEAERLQIHLEVERILPPRREGDDVGPTLPACIVAMRATPAPRPLPSPGEVERALAEFKEINRAYREKKRKERAAAGVT